MGNSPQIVFRDYRKVVTKADATKWFPFHRQLSADDRLRCHPSAVHCLLPPSMSVLSRCSRWLDAGRKNWLAFLPPGPTNPDTVSPMSADVSVVWYVRRNFVPCSGSRRFFVLKSQSMDERFSIRKTLTVQ